MSAKSCRALGGIEVARLREEYGGPHELVKTSDGATLFVRRWSAREESPASVLILHGITAHSGAYGPMVAEGLAAAGYEVFGMDLRGHGLSDGKRGDYPSGRRFAEDLRETLEAVKRKSRKLVVLGHSLGVLSAIVAVKNDPRAVDGLILMSAARRIRAGAYPKPSAAATLKMLVGITVLKGSRLIEYSRSGQVGLDDPLFNFQYSARCYSGLYGVGAMKVARMMASGMIDSPNLDVGRRLEIPVLVAVGDGDELFSTEAAKEFFDTMDTGDKEFLVIPGMRHAVWPRGAYAPVADWLRRKFPGP